MIESKRRYRRRAADGAGNTVTRVSENCGQLFFVYAGPAGKYGMLALPFLSESGLIDRNLVLLRDPHNADYMRGIGDGIDDIEALLNWHEACRSGMPHVSATYCVGNSMGGYAAFWFGHFLYARKAWAFSLQPVGEAAALADLRALLSVGNGVTEFEICYSADDPADREAAEYMAACPGVVLHPYHGNVGKRGRHNVLLTLAEAGELHQFFPAYEPAAS
jgi:hypothetical protein